MSVYPLQPKWKFSQLKKALHPEFEKKAHNVFRTGFRQHMPTCFRVKLKSTIDDKIFKLIGLALGRGQPKTYKKLCLRRPS